MKKKVNTSPNMGVSVGIGKLINADDDYIIGATAPRFYTKSGSIKAPPFVPDKWKDDDNVMAISKNFREGVSFSYPKVNLEQNLLCYNLF